MKSEYAVVYKIRPVTFSIWKMLYDNNAMRANYIYVRRDLLQTFGLKELAESPFD